MRVLVNVDVLMSVVVIVIGVMVVVVARIASLKSDEKEIRVCSKF